MYKNCPEHPVIKEILKNGEPIRLGCCIFNADKDGSMFAAEQVYYLSQQDFAEICLRRSEQKNDCRKNNLFCHSGTK